MLDTPCPKVGTSLARVLIDYGLLLHNVITDSLLISLLRFPRPGNHRLWFATSQCNHKQSTTFPFEVVPTPRSLRVLISHKQVLSSSGNPRSLLLSLSRYTFHCRGPSNRSMKFLSGAVGEGFLKPSSFEKVREPPHLHFDVKRATMFSALTFERFHLYVLTKIM